MRALQSTAFACLVLASAFTSACDPDEGQQTGTVAEVQAPATQDTVEAMDPERKRDELGAEFPFEVPVPEGEVVRGRAQGPDAWDYELLVAASPEAVAEWYESALTARSWVLAERRSLEGGGVELTLSKGGAQTRATIVGQGEGSRVVVVLGVGAPVLQTQ